MGLDLATLTAPYLHALDEHYFATTAVQALALVGAGDALAQLIEIKAARGDGEESEAPRLDFGELAASYDPRRTARMGLLGMFIGGFGTASWLQALRLGVVPRFRFRQLPLLCTSQH